MTRMMTNAVRICFLIALISSEAFGKLKSKRAKVLGPEDDVRDADTHWGAGFKTHQDPTKFENGKAFQTIHSKNGKGEDIITERLISCGIEKYPDGSDMYPCPEGGGDVRPFVKGLDHIGVGFDILTGIQKEPLFEWYSPKFYQASYDSGVYNSDEKVPEQLTLSAVPSGQGGMVSEIFTNFDEFESKSSFVMDVSLGALGASIGFSLSKSSERYRRELDSFEIGVSKQKYEAYRLSLKNTIFGRCPFKTPVFECEKAHVTSAVEGGDTGLHAATDPEDVHKWAKDVKLPQVFADNILKLAIPGKLLVNLKDTELNELGLVTTFQIHKFRYEVEGYSSWKKSKETGSTVSSESQPPNPGPINKPTSDERTTAEKDINTDARRFRFQQAKDDHTGPPRYVRKWVLRQDFITAVENLLPLTEAHIKGICPKILSSRENDVDLETLQDAKLQAIVSDYKRFLRIWGTHYSSIVTYGGQVEVTTMIRKSESEAKDLDESNVEATLEADEVEAEAENDEQSASEVVVETDEDMPITVEEDDDSTLTPQGTKKVHTTSKTSKDKSASSGGNFDPGAAIMGALKDAALAMGTSGVSELIKELELKLSVKGSNSKRKHTLLTRENTKNEIKFLGGDTSVDPDDIGGSGFAEWKNTIAENPAAISTTLEPITNLVRIFAGPNPDESCPAEHQQTEWKAKMLSCITNDMLRMAHKISDVKYELHQTDKKKAKLESIITQTCQNDDNCEASLEREIEEWKQFCSIRVSLVSKRDKMQVDLYGRSSEDSFVAGLSYSSICDRELNRITGNTGGPYIVEAQTFDEATGKPIVDHCAICKAVFENAKCLTTRRECGPKNDQHKIENYLKEINDKITRQKCILNDKYKDGRGSDEGQEFTFGASPAKVQQLITDMNKGDETEKHTWTGGLGWMGWSSLYFAPSEVMCNTISNPVLCEDFINKMRNKICADELKDDEYHAKSRDLISALDFGLMGQSRERSTAKQACECAGFCTPQIDQEVAAGFKQYVKKQTKGFKKKIKAFFDASPESLEVAYEESLIRERLSRCEGSTFHRLPLLPAQVSKWHQTMDDRKAGGTEAKGEYNPDWLDNDGMRSYTGNRMAYIGYCNEESESCFSFDEMNQGAISEMSFISEEGNDVVLKITDVDPKDPAAAEKNMRNMKAIKNKKKTQSTQSHLIKLSRWHKVTSSDSDFDHVGIVYAEMNKKQNGVPQLVVVQSGVGKEDWGSFFKKLKSDLSKHFTMTWNGPKLDDPRRVFIAEDRLGLGRYVSEDGQTHIGDGFCEWIYNICSKIQGTLHPTPDTNPYASQINKLCPAGVVCCPKDGGAHNENAPFWDQQTTKLLYVLSHGRMDGAPVLASTDPINGWSQEDPIYGAGVCPQGRPEVIKQYDFAAGTRADDSYKNQVDPDATLTCVYKCSRRKNILSTKKQCKTNNGSPFETEVKVPESETSNTDVTNMKLCKKKSIKAIAVQQCKARIGKEGGVEITEETDCSFADFDRVDVKKNE